MAWIESHTVLLRHRKLIDLSAELRLKPVHALGHLHALWHAALEQQEDGDLSKWSDTFIANAASFTGDAPRFVSLLEKHGWLDDGRLLHDWLDYAGRYLRRKYERSAAGKLRLTEIWKRHSRIYGEDVDDGLAPQQRRKSGAIAGLTNPPNQPTPPTDAGVSLKDRMKRAANANAN